MNAAIARNQAFPRRTRQTLAQQRFLRRRRRLAAILENLLDPRYPMRHGLRSAPRIPAANRAAVTESLEKIVKLLRDPAITVSERTLRRILTFVTNPTSPMYGEYRNQAGVAAHTLVDEVSGHAGRLAA